MDAAALARLTPGEKEAFHRDAETRVKTFAYERTPPDRPKDIVPLVRTELLKVAVQVVHEGGENNLHYHMNSDTTWLVLRGRVRFYGPGDGLIAELGPEEGVVIPGGARYWFEKTGPDDLEIVQMVGYDRAAGKAQRVNVETHKDWMTAEELRVYEAGSAT
jgi:mannose-6-phosphate isomerase-like protein (cupin superfamily)